MLTSVVTVVMYSVQQEGSIDLSLVESGVSQSTQCENGRQPARALTVYKAAYPKWYA